MSRVHIRRQEILDWLKEHPGTCTQDMCAALGREYRSTADYIRMMQYDKEISSVSVREGKRTLQLHTALVEKTGEKPTHKKPSCELYKAKQHSKPGHYIHHEHRDTNKEPPYPRQGGQGGITNPRTSTYLESVL